MKEVRSTSTMPIPPGPPASLLFFALPLIYALADCRSGLSASPIVRVADRFRCQSDAQNTKDFVHSNEGSTQHQHNAHTAWAAGTRLFFGVAVDIGMGQLLAPLALVDVEENRLRGHD